MKRLIVVVLLLGVYARSGAAAVDGAHADGILESIGNAKVTRAGGRLLVARKDAHAPVVMDFARCEAVGVAYEGNQWWVLPVSAVGAQIHANRALWVLPLDAASKDGAWQVVLRDGALHATETKSGLEVRLQAESATLTKAEARPRSDVFGDIFSFKMDGGAKLEEALAAFYWGTMLPSVVEKTAAAHFPYSSGYVLSTLSAGSYAGSYPAVDHEFQIRGRLAFGSAVDLDIVRRMIGLQFKLMADDPERLYRDPTSVQPDGRREYHVRRDSEDHRVNAGMFPVTGDIEVMEEAWRYYEATKDAAWLRANIGGLEHAAEWVLQNTDQYGRVWSDVYYEDQVIKDGRVTQAQAFAAHAFALLAGMETLLGRSNEAAQYAADSKKMAGVLVAPLPMGYWDAKNQRFIDWVDRNGVTHDHIHLLANELPVTFGYASAEQAAAVRKLIDANDAAFERFPSFVAADIAAYTKSEIGTGGPYDLCAAGRYWYWDAAYRAVQGQNGVLLDQLEQVAAEGAKNGYYMSERYDMDHVYYIDGKDAHGATMYYEYPNAFAAVLIGKYLGLTATADADVKIAPHLKGYGSVEMEIPEYALRYSCTKDGFELKNLSDRAQRFDVDLSGLGFGAKRFRVKGAVVGPRVTVTLAAHGVVRWVPEG
jgi:hypothetical protein